MKVDEAREALVTRLKLCPVRTGKHRAALEAADAYALAVHVDVCTEMLIIDGKSWLCGGEKGYCDRAKELGGSA